MKRTLLLIPLLLVIAMLWQSGGGVNAAATCPSPAPTCAAGGVLTDLTGDYACTVVGTRSDGSVHVTLLEMEFAGDGTGTLLNSTTNSNTAGSSFTAWTFSGAAITYCLSPDAGTAESAPSATGFITVPGASCPIAVVIDSGEGELRLLDTTLDRAEIGSCYFQ